MGKIAISLVTYLTYLVINLLQPPGVSVSIDMPTEIVAGEEYDVSVSIQKGTLEGFSRLQLELPPGISARPLLSANADFSFSDNQVRFIWLKMPPSREVNVVFKIRADERIMGVFNLGSQFSFITNNDRKSISSVPGLISIQPSSLVDRDLIVDIEEFEQRVVQRVSTVADGVAGIACIRQAPVLNTNGQEYTITILVSKQGMNKFAKIEEVVPPGFTAVVLDPKNGIFTFRNRVAKFLWNILPSEPDFYVSYRLVPLAGTPLQTPELNGTFSFLIEDKTLSVTVAQTNRDVRDIQPQEVQPLYASLISQPVSPVIDDVRLEVPTTQPERAPATRQVTERTERRPVTRQGVRTRADEMAFLLEPGQGVYYRVQLAAGHKPIDIRRYFRRYNLEQEVRKEEHEGWIKYSIGSFSLYKEARDYRVHVWNTTEIKDAFVAAYNDGTRITVQEALMIADQQWYK